MIMFKYNLLFTHTHTKNMGSSVRKVDFYGCDMLGKCEIL